MKTISAHRKLSPLAHSPIDVIFQPHTKVFLPSKVFLVSVSSVSLVFLEGDLGVHHGYFLTNPPMVASSSAWSTQPSTVLSCEASELIMRPPSLPLPP